MGTTDGGRARSSALGSRQGEGHADLVDMSGGAECPGGGIHHWPLIQVLAQALGPGLCLEPVSCPK